MRIKQKALASIAVVAVLFLLEGCSTNTAHPTKSIAFNQASNRTQTFTSDQQVQDIYRALQEIPSTAFQFVNAYLKAISTRSGPLARGYLAPTIRNQIPPTVIGSSEWIGKWSITPVSALNGKYEYTVVAYQGILPATKKGHLSWIVAFHADLTVQSLGYNHHYSPWIITSQKIVFRKYLGF